MQSLLVGILLGFVSGISPGPYTTLVATLALKQGFAAGLKASLLLLVTEVPVMLATAFLLTRLPDSVLTGLGIAGGILIIYLGIRTFRSAGEEKDSGSKPDSENAALLRMALVGILSPAPWLFWTVVGSPLLLHSWYRGWQDAVLFVAGLFALLVGTQVTIAWSAASGGDRVSDAWRRRLTVAAACGLCLAGGVLAWQSYQGNFGAMVQRQKSISEEITG